ncbi:hypothetical protein BDN70DRAFT_239894 [Pholiota conissans]|uniref:F-box domain-containing protein n=1 Tax=Pholiota conissans TaxID=109636 RepID=A0A9P5ZF17_9AGAR|nr:hypothetical protein BDN70DRAFT_239894 [Pholiota conissans]
MNTPNIRTASPSARQLPDTAQLPYYHQNVEDFRKELGLEHLKLSPLRPAHWQKQRGNYVRSYVLSNLRIQMRGITPRVKWNLGALWDCLPVELITAIYELLHPIDLYHAIRSTKNIRRFLLNKNSASIWRKSFLNHSDIPFYPNDVSPPKWVSLIFGPATCDDCGLANSLVDYAFRWRKCDDCADYFNDEEPRYVDDSYTYYSDEGEYTSNRLLAVQTMVEEFPDEVDVVWTLATKTYRQDPFNYPHIACYFTPRYSFGQVDEIVSTMKDYLVKIRSDDADARVDYEAFVDVTRDAVEQNMKHAQLCNCWAKNIQTLSQNDFAKFIPAFHLLCSEALLRRGYDPRDIGAAMENFDWTMTHHHWPDVSDVKLNKSKLRKYLPKIEAAVAKCKQLRLVAEFAARQKERQKKILSFYFAALESNFIPEVHSYLPNRHQEIYRLPCFANYLTDPQESLVELPVNSIQQMFQSVDTYLAQNHRPLFQSLFDLMLNAGVLSIEDTNDAELGTCARLAIAIFECCESALVGWEEVAVHACHDGSTYQERGTIRARFSDAGKEALESLAELLHLESLDSILAKDLDDLNRRFVCKTCPFDLVAHCSGRFSLHAMTWRECICHVVKNRTSPSQNRHDPVFDILSPALTEFILRTELAMDMRWCIRDSDVCCRNGHIYPFTNRAAQMTEPNRKILT